MLYILSKEGSGLNYFGLFNIYIFMIFVIPLTIYDDIDSINKTLDTLGALSDDSYRDSRTNGDTIAYEALPMSSL